MVPSSNPIQEGTGSATALFDVWLDSFGIKELVSPLMRTVSVWANNCSPPHASARSMMTAYADLALWFFYIDDYEHDDYEAFFDQCLRILDGSRPTTDSSSLLHAYSDVILRVGSHGHDLAEYLESRRKSVELIRQRIRFSRKQARERPTFDEYYAQRMISVYVYQWMDLWEIIGGFYLDPEERALPELAEAERAVTAWHILQNDARSLRRDIDAGSPNLVLLYAEQKAMNAEDAIAAMRELFRAELENFQSASRSLLQSNPSVRVRQYLELLELLLTGGEKSFWEIRERYDWDALHRLLAAARAGG